MGCWLLVIGYWSLVIGYWSLSTLTPQLSILNSQLSTLTHPLIPMRYSIMLQLVTILTFSLVVAAALFAWVQSRPIPEAQSRQPEIERLENGRFQRSSL
jgi:energy-converting hydrogenase Eha subunit E